MDKSEIPNEERALKLPVFKIFLKKRWKKSSRDLDQFTNHTHSSSRSDASILTMETEEEPKNIYFKGDSFIQEPNVLYEVDSDEEDTKKHNLSPRKLKKIDEFSAKHLIETSQDIAIKHSYHDILLKYMDPEILVEKYSQEKKKLKSSNALGVEFSLIHSMERLKKGVKVWKYNYNKPMKKEVEIRVRNQYFEYLSGKTWIRVSGGFMFGVLIGDKSSTFRIYQDYIKKTNRTIEDTLCCFSVMTEIRTYDFSTTNDVARYDLCIALS